MNEFPIDVLGSGAVVLGPQVTCDGFQADHPVRVQTHVHLDHMSHFSTSTGAGRKVVMSPETYLLLGDAHPEFDVRTNIHKVEVGEELQLDGNLISLVPSDHMLGARQVVVQLGNGMRLGYSGDFFFPLECVIQVDALVVDATYGNPDDHRRYTQAEAEERLASLVKKELRRGPVHIMAKIGPAERALLALAADDLIPRVPVIGSERFCACVNVYRKCGYHIPKAISVDTKDAIRAMKSRKYIRFWGLGQQLPNDIIEGAFIDLTSYRTRDAVEAWDNNQYTVGFCNHADFDGTMEYVRRTGATLVVADGVRASGKALNLARAIRQELAIKARPSSNKGSPAWGA